MWLVPNRTIDITAVATNLPLNDKPEWAAGTTYGLNVQVQRHRKIYQSTIAGNVGIDPALVDQDDASPAWLLFGNINAVACFDGVLANKLVAARGNAISPAYVALGVDPDLTAVVLDFAVISGENIVTLFGLDAARVRLIGLGAGDVVVFDQTRITAGRWVTNWLEWYDTPLSGWRRIEVFENLPLSCTRLLICLEGGTVKLGEVTIGKGLYIGTAQVDGTGGTGQTASYFNVNDYGRVSFVQRPSRRDIDYSVHLKRQHFEQIQGLIEDMTGGLVTGIGAVSRPSSISCGVMGPIKWPEDGSDDYKIQFTVRGVT